MLSYIKGTLVDTADDRVIVENQGLGYEILVPGSIIGRMPLIGETVSLFTYLYVREDALVLYGFFSKADLEIFKLLLGVSGIGPKGALGILSVLSPQELSLAIAMEDAKQITAAPGIGLKTAKKLIIELKDKVSRRLEEAGNPPFDTGSVSGEKTGTGNQLDAVEALTVLGYGRGEAVSAVKKAAADCGSDADVEELLQRALPYLL